MSDDYDPLDDLYDRYKRDPRFDHLKNQPNTFFVGGEGPYSPDIMLIGEAPGRLENAKRQPFQGRAGINLVNILTDLGISPYDVFQTNVVKYWPRDARGKTRPPDTDEIHESREYLFNEIKIVKPKIVGLCGFTAITAIYPKIPNVFHSHGKLLDNKFVPLYHPAGTSYNPSRKPLIISGYQKLKEYLGELSGQGSSSGSAVK